ncbi:MAG: GWxTD domain-containing protein [Lentimicrobium sp.]|nr:GWxTD domain-containing protein [Lentimicrobium sp.]
MAKHNLAVSYSPEAIKKELGLAVYNLDDSSTNLYFRFSLQNLKRAKVAEKLYYIYGINYQVFDGYEKGVLVDSGSWQGIDSVRVSGIVEDSLTFKANTGKNYIVRVTLTDFNTQSAVSRIIELPKAQQGQQADFLLTDINNRPLFRDYISRIEMVKIRSRQAFDSTFQLKFYKFSEKEAAASPFDFPADFRPEEPEFIKNIVVRFQGNSSEPFNLNDEGIYFSGSDENGFRIFRFYDGYPQVGNAGKMRDALRYISTDNEYYDLLQLPPKAAVDKFWIELAGNSERALTLIKRYYARVEEANQLFSLLDEGWKSDRGMIYIVFGSPGFVYRNSEHEEWTYGEPGNPLSVKFYFHIFENSPGVKDYRLIRSEEYRRPWHLAVSNWRR